MKTSPFCSDRCRKIDFFRWWDGRYAISEPLSADFEDQLSHHDDDIDDSSLHTG